LEAIKAKAMEPCRDNQMDISFDFQNHDYINSHTIILIFETSYKCWRASIPLTFGNNLYKLIIRVTSVPNTLEYIYCKCLHSLLLSMSRYLTPSKICLLALIDLYCDSEIPSSATVSVLSFIVSHLNSPSKSLPHHSGIDSVPKFSLSIADFEHATVSLASAIPGRTVWDLLLKTLWDLNCYNAYHEFFDRLDSLMLKPGEATESPSHSIVISRTSPFGIFIRRSRLEFIRLTFHDAIKLWYAFVSYRAPTVAAWRKRISTAASAEIDCNFQELAIQPGDALYEVACARMQDVNPNDQMISGDEVENLLEFQLDHMQSKYHLDSRI
jgi:anaphase-promoting complex subunit 5